MKFRFQKSFCFSTLYIVARRVEAGESTMRLVEAFIDITALLSGKLLQFSRILQNNSFIAFYRTGRMKVKRIRGCEWRRRRSASPSTSELFY